MCCLIVSLCLSVVIHLGCESLVGQAEWWRVRELVQECSTITPISISFHLRNMTSSTSQATCTELLFTWVSSVCQWFITNSHQCFLKTTREGCQLSRFYSASNLVVDIRSLGLKEVCPMLELPFPLPNAGEGLVKLITYNDVPGRWVDV